MAKSDVFMSFVGVTVTPVTTGTPIPITEVVEMEVMYDDDLMPWRADGGRFAKLVALGESNRGARIAGGDVAKFMAVPKGVSCTVVAKLMDALNNTPTGSGTLTFTWTNAIFGGANAAGASRKFAGGGLNFMCYAPDATTDPMTVAQAA